MNPARREILEFICSVAGFLFLLVFAVAAFVNALQEVVERWKQEELDGRRDAK